jgi:two-component system, NtrC family, response regulator AtoC
MPGQKDSWEAGTTIRDQHVTGTPPATLSRLCLVVIRNGLSSTYPLPDEGEVTIGRAEGSRIRIEDRSLSRQHAVLHIDRSGALTIEDLGSSNGTRVRDTNLVKGKPVAIAAGEVVDVGSTMIIVQARTATSRARRIWTHDYFEARLEDETARAERTGGQFAILRVHSPEPRSSDAVQQVLSEVLRNMDVVGTYAPGEYEALLVDTTPDVAAVTVHRVASLLGERREPVRMGLSCYPHDGRNPDALMALASARARGESGRAVTPSPTGGDGKGGDVVVVDPAMQRLYRLVERIAAGTISVLILGETGAGKEVLAQMVHRMSPRAAKPFLTLNCAALSESLLESELFGHERGAFTGAVSAKPGLLETAEGGTVFLDELGELPPSTQVKLLRVIETRQVLRVGSLKPKPIDVRFISATNRDLEAEVARGGFRQDLFFRLNGISLLIPPLRERTSEIEAMARSFLAQAVKQVGRGTAPHLSDSALDLLRRYSWPGNIRELRNVIERAVLLCAGREILPEHLPVEKMRATFAAPSNTTGPVSALDFPLPPPSHPPAAPPPARVTAPHRALAGVDPAPGPNGEAPQRKSIRDELEALERKRILDALAECAGNQTKAAKMLGMSRRTLLNRLDSYAIARPRKAKD